MIRAHRWVLPVALALLAGTVTAPVATAQRRQCRVTLVRPDVVVVDSPRTAVPISIDTDCTDYDIRMQFNVPLKDEVEHTLKFTPDVGVRREVFSDTEPRGIWTSGIHGTAGPDGTTSPRLNRDGPGIDKLRIETGTRASIAVPDAGRVTGLVESYGSAGRWYPYGGDSPRAKAELQKRGPGGTWTVVVPARQVATDGTISAAVEESGRYRWHVLTHRTNFSAESFSSVVTVKASAVTPQVTR